MGCLKITYSTNYGALEEAPIFHLYPLGQTNPASKNRVNYSAFGVQLSGRNFVNSMVTKQYRQGFNGMEQDDEIKGDGNSYDFGARMLDPRLGRWLTIDPLYSKQPDQSPYKAFLNCPVLYADPDGKTEYDKVVINDERTGKTIVFYVSKSTELMTDGEMHNGELLPYQNYYDYSNVTTYTIGKDGSVEETHSTEILYKNGVKYYDYVPLDYIAGNLAEKGDIYDPDNPFIQAGGFYMTSKNGEGTPYHAKNTEAIGDVEDMIGALGGLTQGGGVVKQSSKLSNLEKLNEILEMVKTLSESKEKMESLDKLRKLVQEACTPEKTENKTTTKVDKVASTPYSNTITYPKPEHSKDNVGYHKLATPSEIQSGDTVGSGKPMKSVYPKK